jgi:hypothetical protein
LVFVYDPTFIASYPLVGSNVYDLTGRSSYGLLRGGCYWDSSDKNSFILSPNTSSYFSIRDTILNQLNGASAFTLSIWFNTNSLPQPGSAGTLLYLSDADSANGNNPRPSAGTWLRIFMDSDSNINIEGDPKIGGNCEPSQVLCAVPFNPSTWVSLIISVLDNGIISVMLDGVTQSNVNYNFAGGGTFLVQSPRTSSIGSQQTGNFPSTTYQSDTGFDGKIGSVHIYSGELSTNEMFDLYSKTTDLY